MRGGGVRWLSHAGVLSVELVGVPKLQPEIYDPPSITSRCPHRRDLVSVFQRLGRLRRLGLLAYARCGVTTTAGTLSGKRDREIALAGLPAPVGA